jgi:hypothetical protein
METSSIVLDRRSIQNKDVKNRNRVYRKTALQIIDFCKTRLLSGNAEFTMLELETYVSEKCHTTPGSAGRILRMLNTIGKVQYQLKDRSKSLYSVFTVA